VEVVCGSHPTELFDLHSIDILIKIRASAMKRDGRRSAEAGHTGLDGG
jgi:hypothetical protein